jgi:hypothetical protein
MKTILAAIGFLFLLGVIFIVGLRYGGQRVVDSCMQSNNDRLRIISTEDGRQMACRPATAHEIENIVE